jgi:hypothetical protein
MFFLSDCLLCSTHGCPAACSRQRRPVAGSNDLLWLRKQFQRRYQNRIQNHYL